MVANTLPAPPERTKSKRSMRVSINSTPDKVIHSVPMSPVLTWSPPDTTDTTVRAGLVELYASITIGGFNL